MCCYSNAQINVVSKMIMRYDDLAISPLHQLVCICIYHKYFIFHY